MSTSDPAGGVMEPETYTEGVCADGAAILCDGRPMMISTILRLLNERATQRKALRDALEDIIGGYADDPRRLDSSMTDMRVSYGELRAGLHALSAPPQTEETKA